MTKHISKSLLLLISLSTVYANASEVNDVLPPDQSSADVQWKGHAKIIPGNNMTITGEYGAAEPNDGKLTVNADGTFKTTEPVKLESHLYWDKDSDDVKDVGDFIATNWTLDSARPITVEWGTNVVDGMDVKVSDLMSGSDLSETDGPNVERVSLTVTNEKSTSVPAVDPRAELVVKTTILSTVA
ncbi:hypothetical protein [Photobacterium damselae]|uniref:hypothetical protein n=1 Tax=Photobacterium damselae TaxID=38293 RepID=UPI004068F222